MEWNFSNTIRRGQQDSEPASSAVDEEEGEGKGGRGDRAGDTRRHTLTGPVEVDNQLVRMEIDDTAFVSIGDRSSIVIGEREIDSSGSSEGVGGKSREGGEGGKVCVLQELERTRGDGQEADSLNETPPSSALQHIILPLLTQVRQVGSHVTVH